MNRYLLTFILIFLISIVLYIILKKRYENFYNTDKYFKDILNEKEKTDLDILLNEVLNHLEKENIDYFFAFGSLIGVVRHGMRIPFDDDIDLIISDKYLNKFLKNLKIIKKFKKRTVYSLSKNIKVIHKNWGIPIKISKKNSRYPFIDINTYYEEYNNIVVPKKQLKNGHIKVFNEQYVDIFPLKKAKFDKYIVNIPKNYIKILKKQYGEDVLEICKITYNHKKFCKHKNCENENASEHIHTEIYLKEVSEKFIDPVIY